MSRSERLHELDERMELSLDRYSFTSLARAETLWRVDPQEPPEPGRLITLSPRENSAIELERDQIDRVGEDGGILRIELTDGGTLDLLRADEFDFVLAEAGEREVLDADGFREAVMGTPGTMAFTSSEGDGQAGGTFEVTGEIAHAGAETAELTVSQPSGGSWSREETVTLDLASWRTQEDFAAEFEIPSDWDPGEVELELAIVDADGQRHTEHGHLALFADAEQRDLDWEFSDPYEAPLAGVGRVFADTGTSEQIGTGGLISPEHVLTSAHIFGEAEQFEAVDFAISEDGRLEGGRGEDVVGAEGVELMRGDWYHNDWPAEDLAIVELEQAVDAPTFEPFWNAADQTGRDLTGETVRWAGFPADGVDQGDQADYRWEAAGEVTGYDAASGVMELSDSLAGVSGASGSPVLYEDDGEGYAAGVFAGSNNGTPVAANLDAEAFNWALEIVQAGGYLADLEEAEPVV